MLVGKNIAKKHVKLTKKNKEFIVKDLKTRGQTLLKWQKY